MNTQHILNVAGRYISGINEVQANIFKGTLTVADRPAGVYYFDLSNQTLEDFESYQENLLAEEFYAHPGNLQWNYYLFLLNDELDSKAKENIEKNDKYARKYVLTESEFHDFFTLEKSDAGIRPNIVAEWKRRLDEVGLQDVYGNGTYVDLINNFRTSGSIRHKKAQEFRAANDSDKISFIDRLVLHPGYRPFPIQRDFTFGKVNLFRGINGVGKTSLFEAIEAMICGRCLRNPSVAMPQGCVEAEFNHIRSRVAYDGRNSKQYIDRDLHWYATNSRNNTLYNSFNRFNFFNADAAHNFSIAATEKDASEALFSIILGPEYHHISERNVGTLERLRPEYNRLNDEMNAAAQREQRAERIISNYKEPASLGQLRQAIVTAYLEIGFKRASSADEAALIEERNNQLRPLLIGLVNDNTIVTLKDFDKAFSEFEQKREGLSVKETALRTLTERQTTLTAEEKRLNALYDFLTRCISYIRDEQLMKLEGLQAKEGTANLQKSRIAIVKDMISVIENDSDALTADTTSLESEIDTLKADIKDHEAEMTRLMNSLGQLESVIRQIKSHGREFLALNHNAAECPLCQAIYDRPELERRVLTAKDNGNAEPATFDTLRRQIDGMKKTLQTRESTLKQQRKINQAFSTAFPGQTLSGYAAALDRLQEFAGHEDAVIQELYSLSELAKYAASTGRSEKEFNELKFAVSQNYPNGPAFVFGTSAAFQSLLDDATAAINQCKNELEETTIARTQIGNEIKRLLGVEGDTLFLKDIRELFEKEEKRMLSAKNTVEKLLELVTVRADTGFGELSERVETLQYNLSSLREEQKLQFEYDTARKEHDEATAFINANKARLLKFEKAVETLRALTGDEASAHVAAFFNDNFQEIVDIFKSIHAPKEFKTLNYTDDRLELVTDHGETRTISQISTGQRSALALAIFLSLNGKLNNGPNIIMFDDPVAFIDDLNALSFLDHLRIHTLRSGRQIFFATANMRLAGLFEKKFGFLGDDFKRFPFDRGANALENAAKS